MYTHEELISAVRAVGRDGKTFTLKDVRSQLGFETRDKKEISRFRRRLRAFEKVAAEDLEKLGNNSYRLRPGAFESTASAANAPSTLSALKPEAAPARPVEANVNNTVAVKAEAVQTTPAAAPAQPVDVQRNNSVELELEPASGVFDAAKPANQTQPPTAAQAVQQAAVPTEESRASARTASTVSGRALSVAAALASSARMRALAATAAVSGKVRTRTQELRNLREQLTSCLRAAPLRQHAVARLRGWAEGLRPLSREVLEHLTALRQRVTSNRRRAA